MVKADPLVHELAHAPHDLQAFGKKRYIILEQFNWMGCPFVHELAHAPHDLRHGSTREAGVCVCEQHKCSSTRGSSTCT